MVLCNESLASCSTSLLPFGIGIDMGIGIGICMGMGICISMDNTFPLPVFFTNPTYLVSRMLENVGFTATRPMLELNTDRSVELRRTVWFAVVAPVMPLPSSLPPPLDFDPIVIVIVIGIGIVIVIDDADVGEVVPVPVVGDEEVVSLIFTRCPIDCPMYRPVDSCPGCTGESLWKRACGTHQ